MTKYIGIFISIFNYFHGINGFHHSWKISQVVQGLKQHFAQHENNNTNGRKKNGVKQCAQKKDKQSKPKDCYPVFGFGNPP